MPAQLTVLVGGKGSGKSLLQTALAQVVHQVRPAIPQVANQHIRNATYYENILKFFAIKLIRRDRTYIEAYVDEVAQSGMEARGQGSSEDTALRSYLFTLSRKVEVNGWLATQLMSMMDKRIQWIGDWAILCEAHPDPVAPNHFHYKVYDDHDNKRNEFVITYEEAKRWIFDRRMYRTQEIPFERTLLEAYTEMFNVTKRDLERFDRIVARQ